MNIGDCYRKIGSDYADVLTRFGSEALVTRFALRFLDDPSYGELQAALARGDTASAFRAAHTLKGLCANLGFTALRQASGQLCDRLRAGEPVSASDTAAVREAYGALSEALGQLRDSRQ